MEHEFGDQCGVRWIHRHLRRYDSINVGWVHTVALKFDQDVLMRQATLLELYTVNTW